MNDPGHIASNQSDFHRALARDFMRGQWQNEAARQAPGAPVSVEAKGVYGPKPGGEAHLWPWALVRAHLDRSIEAVPESFTSRRSLLFNNPGLPKGTTTSINMGVQLIRPGELAWAHRHSISALRFVIAGNAGLHTIVNGERCPMEANDLVLTPAWTWHDHHNDDTREGIWLDVLDGPVVSALNQTFMEPYGEDRQPPGARLPSPETVLPPPGAGARMCFPWREAECALSEAAREKGSAYDGITLEYVDPETGAPVLPAHSCWLHLLRPGEATQAHRHTSSAVFHVVRGRGRTKVGDKVLEWGPRDCLAVPNWAWHEHANLSASEDAVLFSVNDTPLVKYLGLYREEPALTIAHGAPRMFGAFLRAAWA